MGAEATSNRQQAVRLRSACFGFWLADESWLLTGVSLRAAEC